LSGVMMVRGKGETEGAGEAGNNRWPTPRLSSHNQTRNCKHRRVAV